MFYIWIDDSQLDNQIETQSEFAQESQRISGFQQGDVISSKIMNTAIRQANLVVVALAKALGLDTDYSVASSVENLQQAFETYFGSIGVGTFVPNTRTIAGLTLSSDITKTALLTAINVEDGAQKNATNTVIDANYKHITVTTTSVSDGTNTFEKYVLPSDVVQDNNYVHTDNNFTNSDKTKLDGIESGAQVNTVDSVNGKTGTVVLDADDISDTGTTNKFVTETEKSTWNAKQNALTFDSTPTAGSTNPVTSEGVKTAIDNAIVAVYKPQGKSSISTLNGLTKTVSMNGYVYDMTDSGTLTNYDGTTEAVKAKDNVCFFWNDADWYWDNFAEVVDLSGYVQKTTEIAGIQINNGISASTLLNALFDVSVVEEL